MKPILFNTEMVRAFLAGRKQVMRRAVKPRYRNGEAGFRIVTNAHTGKYVRVEYFDEWEDETRWLSEPYRPGDILYVRETWAAWSRTYGAVPVLYYKADGNAPDGIKWRPSIDTGECIKKRQAKRAIIEYDDNSRQILRKGIICWFDGDGKTYVADYELIGLDERDVVVLGHSVVELGKKLLALRGNT